MRLPHDYIQSAISCLSTMDANASSLSPQRRLALVVGTPYIYARNEQRGKQNPRPFCTEHEVKGGTRGTIGSTLEG